MYDASCTAAVSSWELAPEFNVVVAYEGFAAGRQAMRFFENLVSEFGDLFTFVPHIMRFDQGPAGRALLGAEPPIDPDMIVVAAREGEEVPVPIRNWMRQWIGRRSHRETAMVALVAANPDDVRKRVVTDHLRAVAQESGMRFLCKDIEWPADETRFPVEIAVRTSQ